MKLDLWDRINHEKNDSLKNFKAVLKDSENLNKDNVN